MSAGGSGATKEEIPFMTTVNQVIAFMNECDAAGGGLSQEPHPNGVDSVI